MRVFRIVLIILFSGLCAYSSSNSREKQFICGMILLNSKPINDSIKSLRYSELQKVTGVTGKEVISFIEQYYEKPEEWEKIENSILKLLNNKDSIPIKK